ncbi:hypothetical protein SAMN06265365_101237 [Tistlia consotensis]|uniref:DUF6969 domain-containing protein n=1 Tax=Tistlia consotensis USBA 355 TaxID=560819 RepID=A0A1Y6B8C1_9PROT|nr:hypothetical protein [Tistlia consotensis]SME89653.1 hypothetical protein SAMN05428998_101235 [Tistlia consotensis USBA 355]SNR26160.1 hypothetical protein SAMN06265365_101237 [Tistlia consotensis]
MQHASRSRSGRSLEGCQPLPQIDFAALDRPTLEAMAVAAAQVAEVHRVLAKTGDNVVGELLRGTGTFYEWDHYPKGDVYDHETHSQYYYHAHPPEQRFADEHGHFHTFLRPRGMPAGVRPAPVPNYQVPLDADDALSHLVAIAMDSRGLPVRLFTVNRWVTGETWYGAEDVIRMLPRFSIGHARPSWPVNRWISGMIAFYRPFIVGLLRQRDQAVRRWQSEQAPPDVYEDRRLEVTSYLDIDLLDDLRRLEAAQAAA